MTPYHFVAAHNGHNAQGLDAIFRGIETDIFVALIPEYDIGMNVCIQIIDTRLVVCNGILESRDVLRII